MVAPNDTGQRGSTAAPTVALRTDVFDILTAARGATNDSARARLVGVDRATISRMRRRKFTPSMAVAMRIAATLGSSVDFLFERVEPSDG